MSVLGNWLDAVLLISLLS